MITEHPPAGSPGEPGNRLPGEPDKAYRAFVAYRDLGAGRSLDVVARQLRRGRPGDDPGTPRPGRRERTGQIQTWSVTYRWVERARAWDCHLDRQARSAQEAAVVEMNRRHATAARAIQAKAFEALRGLATGDLSAADIVRAVVEGTKLERLAMGLVTDAVRREVESDEKVTLEIVERIVPVSTDRSVPTRALPVADAEPSEPSEFELPDEPPSPAPARR